MRVSQITSLANDLALALATPSIRIEAPVPGKSVVGIEVPNNTAALVTLLGTGMGAVASLEGRVFSEAHGDTVHVVVVNLAGGGLRFTVQVSDTTKPPTGILVEVSGPDDRIRGLAGYRLELRP